MLRALKSGFCEIMRSKASFASSYFPSAMYALARHREDVAHAAVKVLGPDVATRGGVDELGRDAHLIAGAALDQLHRDERLAVDLVDLVDSADVRVVERRRCARLALADNTFAATGRCRLVSSPG